MGMGGLSGNHLQSGLVRQGGVQKLFTNAMFIKLINCMSGYTSLSYVI